MGDAVPGRYGGYGIRTKGPGSAHRPVEPVPELWTRQIARADRVLAEPFTGVTITG